MVGDDTETTEADQEGQDLVPRSPPRTKSVRKRPLSDSEGDEQDE